MGLGISWGPATWYLLHVLSLNWQEKYVPLYINFLNLLSRTIPCMDCRRHFNRNVRRTGGIHNNCKSKEKMVNWLIDLHNRVNKSNNKKVFSYDKAKNFYYKNGNLIYKRHHLITFMREYIGYNFKIMPNKSLKMMMILAKIFPFERKRKRFKVFLRRNNIRRIGRIRWLKRYKKILM